MESIEEAKRVCCGGIYIPGDAPHFPLAPRVAERTGREMGPERGV